MTPLQKNILSFLSGLVPIAAFFGYTTWESIPKPAMERDIEQLNKIHLKDDAQNDLEFYKERVDRLNKNLLDNKNYQLKYKDDSPAQETLKEQEIYLDNELKAAYKQLERAERRVYQEDY